MAIIGGACYNLHLDTWSRIQLPGGQSVEHQHDQRASVYVNPDSYCRGTVVGDTGRNEQIAAWNDG